MQRMCTTSGTLISATCMHTSPPKTLRGIDMDAAVMEFTLKTSRQSKHSWMQRISMPADGRPRKALVASKDVRDTDVEMPDISTGLQP